MRVAVIGSRTATLQDVILAIYAFTQQVGIITHVVSGGAKGADSHAVFYARCFQVPVTIHPADWNQYGKRAGFLRNITIVEDCEHVLAIWDGLSHGTTHSMNLARERNIPVFCHEFRSQTNASA